MEIKLSKKQKKLVDKYPISPSERKSLETTISQLLGNKESKGVDTLSIKELKQLEIDCADTLSELQWNKKKYGDFQPMLVATIKKVELFVRAELEIRKKKKE